jgi:CheY-like chemotaxis protein
MSAILYVEDHDDTRTSMCRLLTHWGHTVAAAATMRAGIALANVVKFDAILSDVGLPDGDGYQFLRAVRARWPDVPAVAYTAWCTEQDRAEATAAGFNLHLCKPMDIERLRAVFPPV